MRNSKNSWSPARAVTKLRGGASWGGGGKRHGGGRGQGAREGKEQDQAVNIYFFKKSVFNFILNFPLFEIGLSLNGFSKIGLRPWVKEFFGWCCNHFFKTFFVWLDFPVFKIGLFQNGFSKKNEAISTGFCWMKLWPLKKKVFFYLDGSL